LDTIPYVQIVPVQTNAARRRFINLPYKLYRNEPNWVPPLRLVQNKLFASDHLFWKKNPHQFFIAIKNKRCAGRIATFVNKHYNSHLQVTHGFFGFLEAENDAIVFRALFDAADQFLKQQGCTQVIGPMNPDIHNELGILVQGFQAPSYIMLTYHFPYYDEQIKAHGFSKFQDFFSYKMDASRYKASLKMDRVGAKLLQRHQISIRTPDIKNFEKELELFHSIYNDAFADHWGFVPMPKDEFLLLAKDMKKLIDTRMVLIAEHDNQPIAFVLAIPNINVLLHKIPDGRLFPFGIFKLLMNKNKIRSIRIITAAVRKKYQHWGLGAVLFPDLMKRALEFRYEECELSWVAEDNKVMNAIAMQLAGAPYKTYRLYKKVIE
jgi:GNAT superfamily N-acetyltransferase